MTENQNTTTGIGAGTITLGFILILVLVGLGYYFLMPQKSATINGGNSGGASGDLDKPIEGVDPKAEKAVGVLTDPQFFKGLNSFAESIYNMVQNSKAQKQAGQGVAVYPQPQPVGQQTPQWQGPFSPQYYANLQ